MRMGPEVIDLCHAELNEPQKQGAALSEAEVQDGLQKVEHCLVRGSHKP